MDHQQTTTTPLRDLGGSFWQSFRSSFRSNSTKFPKNGTPNVAPPFSRAESVKLFSDDNNTQPPAQEDSANIISRTFFLFASSVFWGRAEMVKEDPQQELQFKDFWILPCAETATVIQDKFAISYAANAHRANIPRLTRAMMAVAGRTMLEAALIKVVNTMLQFSYPLFLQQLLYTLQPTSGRDINQAFAWAGGLALAMLLKALTENSYFHRTARGGRKLRVAMSTAVFKKSLNLSQSARQSKTVGEIVNLMQLDANKIAQFMDQICVLWDGVFQLFGYTIIVYFIIGWSAFVGLGFMICAIPLQAKVTRTLMRRDRRVVKVTDERVKKTNEVLQGMLAVKTSAWETTFLHMLGETREKEMTILRGNLGLRAFSTGYMMSMPALTAVVTITVYTLAQQGEITAAILFSSLTALNQLRFPLMMFPLALAQLAQASISRGRLAAFFALPEVSSTRIDLPSDSPHAVEMKDVTVWWSDPSQPIPSSTFGGSPPVKPRTIVAKKDNDTKPSPSPSQPPPEPKPALVNISMQVRKGELLGVVGVVGSGKSALISTILGEMHLASGEIAVQRPMAYSAQTPWILNATVKDNIIFGGTFNQERYNAVVTATQLTRDLELLPYGDNTEIGERGVSLSGGQKARISMARAAYNDAELVLLDDPISALDPEVASKLFHECIVKLLATKTRIMVTNQLDMLKHCDRVIVIGPRTPGGPATILETGTFQQLVTNGLDFSAMIKRHHNEEEKDGEQQEKEKNDNTSSSNGPGKKVGKGNMLPASSGGGAAVSIMTIEDRAKGAVASAIYATWIRKGGGRLVFGGVYSVFMIAQAAAWVNMFWLSLWSQGSATGYATNSLTFYLVGYALTAILMGFAGFSRSYAMYSFSLRASTALHAQLLSSVLHAPMWYFDTTPTGRILQRFSRDIYSIDYDLPEQLQFFTFSSMMVVISLATIGAITPIFFAFLVPLSLVYYVALTFYRPVMRDAKRVGSIVTSPVYSQFTETLGGLSSIRAYGSTSSFLIKHYQMQDSMSRMLYSLKICERWLGLRLEIIGAIVCLLSGCLAVLSVREGSIHTGMAGLSISYGLNTTLLLSNTIRSFASLEAAMNSVERIHHTGTQIPQEKWQENEYGNELVKVSDDWPKRGALSVRGLTLKYRKDTPIVLHDVSFEVNAGERIGVVGRTGSGKSSTFLSLMRIVEPTDGTIMLDGVDISRITLETLRSRLGIAPQLSVLFSGSLRYNLDPFNKYDDVQIWEALEQVRLKDLVQSLPNKLNSPVAEYGENFSQGERQLISFARILLKRPSLLLLDETTASLDNDTDVAIQTVVREAFKNVTIIVIAHRIKTIIDSSRILVLSDGRLVEYDTPQNLLRNPTSLFSQAVNETGESTAKALRKQASGGGNGNDGQ